MNSVIQSLTGRKSVRVYTEREISEEDVQIILNAAAQAPTAGNQQLYTILRISDPEKKHRLSVSCDNQPFIEQAKLILVFCADCLKWYNAFRAAGCAPRRPGPGDLLLAVSDTNIAAQNAVTFFFISEKTEYFRNSEIPKYERQVNLKRRNCRRGFRNVSIRES